MNCPNNYCRLHVLLYVYINKALKKVFFLLQFAYVCNIICVICITLRAT